MRTCTGRSVLCPAKKEETAGERKGTEMADVEMNVAGVVLDPTNSMPIVILRDKKQERTLPIWVGVFEASSIAMGMEGVGTLRPLTHDLLKSVIEGLKAKVTRITVDGLREDTFYANIWIKIGRREVKIDSRPSDAIALAVRSKSPIFVSEEVLAGAADLGRFREGEGGEKLWEFLEKLSPEDFGKYKM